MERKTPLLVICGPTASGKTGLAVAVAKRLNGEVVSADSMQLYRRMDIGTAKPTDEEMVGVPHHLIDLLDPGERFSVAQYVERAKAVIAEVDRRGRLPIVCGGTGLYVDSLTRNIRFVEMDENPALRKELAALAEAQGNQSVWEMLYRCDPQLAKRLHPNNLGRVIRGIEVYRASGVPLSEWQRRSREDAPAYRLCMVGLHWPRERLYERIGRRVDAMMEQGLMDEARALWETGLSSTAMQAIGYKELFAYFSGEISLETAVEEIKRESRRYAKRQMTWLRRDERVHWIAAEEYGPDGLAGLVCGLAEPILEKGEERS